MRAISASVYRCHWNDEDYDPTNGGASGRYDRILVVCPYGPDEVDGTEDNLFKAVSHKNSFGKTVVLEPYNQPEGMCGPMFGGNYAASSDSRFCRTIESEYGGDFYGAVPIHDRFETWALYDALSR